jgi:D-glycero-D-manno-heptose 1,7-bisphosphate phosphatase
MILRGAEEWDIDLSGSYMVGDRWKDIEAGARAGCTTILVRSPCSGEPSPGEPVHSDYVVDNLVEASRIILSGEGDST